LSRSWKRSSNINNRLIPNKPTISRDNNYAQDLYEASIYAKDNLKLSLTHVDKNNKQFIPGIEKILRLALRPILNSYSNRVQHEFDANETVLEKSIENAIKNIS